MLAREVLRRVVSRSGTTTSTTTSCSTTATSSSTSTSTSIRRTSRSVAGASPFAAQTARCRSSARRTRASSLRRRARASSSLSVLSLRTEEESHGCAEYEPPRAIVGIGANDDARELLTAADARCSTTTLGSRYFTV